MRNILSRLQGRSTTTDTEPSTAGGFAVIDVETTGLIATGNDRVVEVAVVHVSPDGDVEGEWETLVNPQRDLGKQSIHHVRAADILDAPTFAEAAPQLVDLLSRRVLVAHNASFDSEFLSEELSRISYGPGVPVAVLCTMRLAKDIIPGAGRSLADCCAHFDIDLTGAHRAGADALATAHLLSEYIRATPGEALWAQAIDSAKEAWAPLPYEGRPWKPRPAIDVKPPHFLERIAIRLPEHAGPEAEHDYLALLDRVLLDRDISAHEAADIVTLADRLELGRNACERLNLTYFQTVAAVAWADAVLTEAEKTDLRTLAQLLRVPDSELQAALTPPSTPSVPPTDVAITTFELRLGDIVVLTGDMARPRQDWAAELDALGLVWINYINKKVRLLAAADPDSLSGKALKARDYGITIVNEDGLTKLVELLRSTERVKP